MSDGLTFELPPALLEAVADRVAARLAEQLAVAEPSPWLDTEQAARYLACDAQRVRDLVHQGRLRCAKDGRRSLFRREWLDGCLSQPA